MRQGRLLPGGGAGTSICGDSPLYEAEVTGEIPGTPYRLPSSLASALLTSSSNEPGTFLLKMRTGAGVSLRIRSVVAMKLPAMKGWWPVRAS